MIDDVITVRRYSNIGKLNQKSLNAKGLEKTLIKGCSVLEELGVKYWISSGTLLGLNRDKNLIPYDKDVDIHVLADMDIYKIVKKMPFNSVLRVVSSNNRYMQFAFFDEETKAIFDIFFFYEKADLLVNRNDYGIFWYPIDKIQNLTTISFNNRKYPAPDPSWYCEFMYGKDWRTPDNYKEHWVEYYIKNSKGFIFTGNKNVNQLNYY